MMSIEIIVWGYVEVPYSYLKEFGDTVAKYEIEEGFRFIFFKNIESPKDSYKTAIASFSGVYKYDETLEDAIVDAFEFFLGVVPFLSATLLVELGSERTRFLQYVFNGDKTLKFEHKVELKNNEHVTIPKG